MILSKLPNEIMTHIILQLEVSDILRCCTVSKEVNEIIKGSSAIQYRIELAANGLLACENASCPASGALLRLKEQQYSWSHCKWRTMDWLEINPGCRTYELRNGIWAYGYNEFPTNADVPTDYTTKITCFALPSAAPLPTEARKSQWTLDNLDLTIRDFTMDPLIDLLVLVEQTPDDAEFPFRVHMRRLSDGLPHVMAANSVLDFAMGIEDRVSCSFGVQLYGSHVGVLVRQEPGSEYDDCMVVWNWCTGEQELYLGAINCSFDDFAFIDSCTIMLAVNADPVTLEIWRVEKNERTGRCEPIFPDLIGRFNLPPARGLNAYINMHFDGSPSLSLAGAKTMDGTPFTPVPEPHILALSFGVMVIDPIIGESTVPRFTMVMRPSMMIDMLEESTENQFEWFEWGIECTRWLQQDLETKSWEPCSFGGRYAVVGPLCREEGEAADNPPATSPQVIRLYDFRPDVVARLMKGSTDPTHVGHNTIRKKNIFVHDIVSTLPYHLVTSEVLPTLVSGVMMDESRLVCTKAELDDEWRTLLVLAF